jgi:thiamine biosynthesis lipoprotein
MMRRAQPWLGTLVEITVPDAFTTDAARCASALNAAFAAVALVHRTMSFHDPASDVSAINRLAVGDTCTVDPHTAAVLRCALMLEAESDGVFNIACADALVRWGLLPTDAEDDAAVTGTELAAAPPRGVVAVDDEDRVTRLRYGRIDLGGIAKGYAVDIAVDVLQAAGIGAACVNAGGDLRGFGDVDFPVVVRDPQLPTQAGRHLFIREQALATSACYFSARVHDGLACSALVDGADGSPVVHARSASVVAPRCMLADGLTKLVMASGDASHPLLARFSATAFLI